MIIFPTSAWATKSSLLVDPLIEGAKLCTRHLPRYEREYGIPAHLLSAIASTESGRYHDGLKIRVPWPWTINAEGKGYFFDSKGEAIAAVRRLRAQGVQSIDVGCMQVNLYHHPQAFSSLEQAFEPENNVGYAASFLRNLYQEGSSWKKAAADYHSRTPSRGNEYAGLVYNSWYQIIDKLRDARVQVPNSSIAGLNDMRSTVLPTRTLPTSSQTGITRISSTTTKQSNKKLASHATPRMNSVKVSKKENGVVVIRPDRKHSEIITVAQAQMKPTPVSDVRTLQVDNSSHSGYSGGTRISGPRFIFSE